MAKKRELKIYKITNHAENKIYIGQTIRTLPQRIAHHRTIAFSGMWPDSLIYNAIRNFPKEAIKIETIAKACTRAELDYLEAYFIITLNADQPEHGYNKTEGRRGQRQMSEIGKKKIGDALRGRPKSKEHKAKMSLSTKSRPRDWHGRIVARG